MIVTGEGGTRVRGDYPQNDTGRAIMRRDLDAELLECAVAAGVHFEERVQVRDPLIDNRGTVPRVRGVVLTTAGGKSIRMPACITVAADGRHSALAFALGLARHPTHPRRWAIGSYFEQVDGVTDVGEMHVRRGHYIGVARVPGGAVNVCLVTGERRGLENPEQAMLHRLRSDRQLRGRFDRAARVAPIVALGPLAVETSASGMPGLLLAGDAAGFVDPMTGDGLRFAVEGGELAARAAMLMLDDGTVTGYETLDRWRRQAFRRKLAFNRALRALVESPVAVRAASVTGRALPAIVRTAIAVAGDARR
jgi:flavin-dependent dehydrogenase